MRIKVKKGTGQYLDDTDHPTFEQWKGRVDDIISRYTGVYLDDLPDCPYYDWYEARLRPIRAANKVLRNADADCF